jgi:hypothetical protein
MPNQDFQQSLNSATARKAAAITPDTNNDLPNFTTRGIWVGGVGNVVLDPIDGAPNITFTAVPAGTLLPVQARRVRATSTATLMVALY